MHALVCGSKHLAFAATASCRASAANNAIPSRTVVARPALPAVSHRQRIAVIRHAGDMQQQVADAGAGAAGQMSAAVINTMKEKIGEALQTEQVQITDAYGDGRHVCIDVVSPLFEGQGSMQRQRMVYKAIWLELQEAVHAVDAMVTKTPQEASS